MEANDGDVRTPEQQALEHMRKAKELGSTLKDHAGKFGLDVQQLYQLRRRLVRKGALGPTPRRKAREPSKAAHFAGAHWACSAGTEQHVSNVPAGASDWLVA